MDTGFADANDFHARIQSCLYTSDRIFKHHALRSRDTSSSAALLKTSGSISVLLCSPRMLPSMMASNSSSNPMRCKSMTAFLLAEPERDLHPALSLQLRIPSHQAKSLPGPIVLMYSRYQPFFCGSARRQNRPRSISDHLIARSISKTRHGLLL